MKFQNSSQYLLATWKQFYYFSFDMTTCHTAMTCQAVKPFALIGNIFLIGKFLGVCMYNDFYHVMLNDC